MTGRATGDRQPPTSRWRAWAVVIGGGLGFGVLLVVHACGGRETGHPKGPIVPPGVGYGEAVDDVRVLSKDDCLALRDHQIELAVDDALVDAGGRQSPERLTLEARLRNETHAATEAWVQRCSGRLVLDRELRCMRNATTPRAFNACGESGDAGRTDASRTFESVVGADAR